MSVAPNTPKTPRYLGFLFLDFVGDQGPDGHADERQPQHPAQHLGADAGGDPGPQRTGQAVVDEGGHQDAQEDGQRLLEARRQNEGQQLRLVANLRQGDHTG